MSALGISGRLKTSTSRPLSPQAHKRQRRCMSAQRLSGHAFDRFVGASRNELGARGRAPGLRSRVAHVHARRCRSAREEPEGRCRGERCGQDQQQIGEPRRLGRCAGGSGAIEVVDLVRVDHLRRIRHRICHCIRRCICFGGVRGICARRRWRAGALGRWSGRSRRRSRYRTFAPACGIERLIRRRRHHRGRGHHRGGGFRPFLRDGLGRLLLRSRLARLRAASGACRLPFGLCLRLRSWTRGVARFPLRLRRRRSLSGRIGGLLWHPYGAGISIVVARLRTR